MKNYTSLFLLTLSFHLSYSQINKGFNSVFQKIDTGYFEGTTNGLLIIKDTLGTKVLYDFQGSFGELKLIKDFDTIYDVSRKLYSGKTTSGKTEIIYETYATSNRIAIKINGQWFEESNIDGACEYPIDNLKFVYQAEKDVEYLILIFTKDIEINNGQYLFANNKFPKDENNYIKLNKEISKFIICKNSTIVFAIKR
jgi:hypothetical protein